MSRYIDADKLIEYAEKRKFQGVPVDVIKSKETADVEEVRHGEWVTRNICCFEWTVCSVCGASFKPDNWENVWKKLYGNPAYCPLCGAKMDGGEK